MYIREKPLLNKITALRMENEHLKRKLELILKENEVLKT